jgi:hypothetical protein
MVRIRVRELFGNGDAAKSADGKEVRHMLVSGKLVSREQLFAEPYNQTVFCHF